MSEDPIKLLLRKIIEKIKGMNIINLRYPFCRSAIQVNNPQINDNHAALRKVKVMDIETKHNIAV